VLVERRRAFQLECAPAAVPDRSALVDGPAKPVDHAAQQSRPRCTSVLWPRLITGMFGSNLIAVLVKNKKPQDRSRSNHLCEAVRNLVP